MKTPREPLNVGERVRVYGRTWDFEERLKVITGTIERVDANEITVKAEHAVYICHPKQCRRLVKKPKETYFANEYPDGITGPFPSRAIADSVSNDRRIAVIELVLKKRHPC